MLTWLKPAAVPALPALLCEIGIVLAVLACTVLLLRALAPKRGTLEWIAMYDRPELSFDLPGEPFRLIELLPCLVTALAAGLLYLLAVALQSRLMGTTLPEMLSNAVGRAVLLGGVGVFALTAACGFFLTRDLYGSWLLAAGLALLLSLDFFADYNQVLSCAALFFCFHRWMRADPDESWRCSAGWLLGAEAVAVFAVLMEPAMIFPVGCLALTALFVLLLRFHLTHRIDRLAQLLFTLFFAAAAFYLCALVGRAALESALSGNFSFLSDGGFYLRAVTGWFQPAGLLRPARSLAGVHFPLILLGLAAAAVSIFGCRRYGHFEGLLLPALMAGTVLMWALTGVNAMCAAAAPACGYFFAHFLRRGHKKTAVVCLILCFAVTLAYDLALLLRAIG